MQKSLLGQNKKKVFCRTCNSVTFHKLIGLHHRLLSFDDNFANFDTSVYIKSESLRDDIFQAFQDFAEIHEYRLLACEGCGTSVLEDAIAFREYCWWKDDDENSPRQIWFFLYYPSISYTTRQPKLFDYVSRNLIGIYEEIINSFNFGAYTLCSMGLRALLEGICNERGITDEQTRQLSEKIKILKQKNHIPEDVLEGLVQYKFLGDGAAHRLVKPERDDIVIALDFIEYLMSYLYESKSQLVSTANRLVDKQSSRLIQKK